MTQLYVHMLSYVAGLQHRFDKADRERGATAVEYGLLVGLIAVVIIVAVTALGGRLTALFNQITGAL